MNSANQTDILKGQRLIEETLQNGSALGIFEKMLVYQGVDNQLAADLCSGRQVLAKAKHVTPILASTSGMEKCNPISNSCLPILSVISCDNR